MDSYTRVCKECGKTIKMRKRPGGKWIAYEDDGTGFNTVHIHKKYPKKKDESFQKEIDIKKENDRSPSARREWEDTELVEEEEIDDEEDEPVYYSRRSTHSYPHGVDLPKRKLNTAGWVITVLGLLILTILIFPQLSKPADNLIRILSQLIGWGIYVLPVGLIVAGLRLFSPSKRDLLSLKRATGIVLFFVWLLTVMDLIVSLNTTQQTIPDGMGGGSIGKIFAQILFNNFSTGGVTIALLTWLLVTVIMMFDIPRGGMVIILGLLGLIILFSPQRSAPVDSLIETIVQFMGWGIAILPIGLIVIGLWLLSSREIDPLSPKRVAGILFFFVWLLTVMDLILSLNTTQQTILDGIGGGSIGNFFRQILFNNFSTGEGTIALLTWLLATVIMMFDIPVGSGATIVLGLLILMIMIVPPRTELTINILRITGQILRWLIVILPVGLIAIGLWIYSRLRLPEEQHQLIEDLRELLAELNINIKRAPLPETTESKTSEPVVNTPAPTDSTIQWQLPEVTKNLDAGNTASATEETIEQRTRLITETLATFGVPVQIVEINRGSAITQFCVEPLSVETDTDSRKGHVSKIVALADDLAVALTVPHIQIQEPAVGQSYVSIEVPNNEMTLVALRDIVDSESFQSNKSPLRMALGSDIVGHPVVTTLETMPHLLIAGTIGSGKSVFINVVITCFLSNNTPDDLRLMLVDPKHTELTGYNGIPHLLSPVVVETDRAIDTLQSMTREMDQRYHMLEQVGSRNITDYNAKKKLQGSKKLPYLVIVINELADLMLTSRDKTERAIVQLAQLGRAAGIHIILATQRPLVDVITYLIKANFPTRIAFAVASNADSQVILDQPGAERLLGRGDMLFLAANASEPVRLQGAFVSDQELQTLLDSWRTQMSGTNPSAKPAQPATNAGSEISPKQSATVEDMTPADSNPDPLLSEAIDYVRKKGSASISMLQRHFRIGVTRAARIIDMMEEKGIVGPPKGKGQLRRILDHGTINPKEQKVTSSDEK